MDLFEVETAFQDVIILQTVLEEVKNRSLPLYHRLISLTKNEDKRFFVFFNEFRLETYVTRDQGESINDRNDRAVRKAVQWYGEHLQEAVRARGKSVRCPSVVMISDDKDNLRKAKIESLHALSCKLNCIKFKNLAKLVMIVSDYVSGLKNADQLLDMVSAGREQRENKSAKNELFYPEVSESIAAFFGEFPADPMEVLFAL